jgi:hypothetical protein
MNAITTATTFEGVLCKFTGKGFAKYTKHFGESIKVSADTWLVFCEEPPMRGIGFDYVNLFPKVGETYKTSKGTLLVKSVVFCEDNEGNATDALVTAVLKK